jgi:hypothetical protein
MPEKPRTAEGYRGGHVELVKATCLYVATKLGDLIDDVVVVGGLAPTLLIDASGLPEGAEAHVGTMDLDVGLKLAILSEERYRVLSARLREAGFTQDQTEEGRPTRQRWRIAGAGTAPVTMDFLIQPSLKSDRGGALRDIEKDFAAVIAPGLGLAFRDRVLVALEGRTILGESARRDMWVCGPGAFVVLKGLAFHMRGENKDAYDLYYLVRNYGNGVGEVVRALRPLLGDADANTALDYIRGDFIRHDATGPVRVASFLHGQPDDATQADVVAFMRALLDGVALPEE